MSARGWEADLQIDGDLTDEEMVDSPAAAGQTVFYSRSFPIVNPTSRVVTDDESDVTVKKNGTALGAIDFTLDGSGGKITLASAASAGDILTITYSYTRTVGWGQGFDIDHSGGVEGIYGFGSRLPKEIKEGNITLGFTIERVHVDRDLIGKEVTVESWSSAHPKKDLPEFTIKAQPFGSTAGKPKITLNSAKFNEWHLSMSQDAIIMDRVTGVAKSITLGTV